MYDAGVYIVSIIGTLPLSAAKTETFTLTVSLPSNNAPYFVSSLQNFTMSANATKIYTIPSIKDDENDLYSVSYMLGSASSFTTNNNGKFTFSPKVTDSGTFTITITLRDYNAYNPLAAIYIFTVDVISATSI